MSASLNHSFSHLSLLLSLLPLLLSLLLLLLLPLLLSLFYCESFLGKTKLKSEFLSFSSLIFFSWSKLHLFLSKFCVFFSIFCRICLFLFLNFKIIITFFYFFLLTRVVRCAFRTLDHSDAVEHHPGWAEHSKQDKSVVVRYKETVACVCLCVCERVCVYNVRAYDTMIVCMYFPFTVVCSPLPISLLSFLFLD